jgi:kynureninase
VDIPPDPFIPSDIERIRSHFPILERTTYLANHSLGAMPVQYADALRAHADGFVEHGVKMWEHGWWTAPIDVGDVLAPILGAPPGSVIMLPNVSTAEWVVASCFDWASDRRRVVYTAGNFPSVMYAWEAHPFAEVVTVPSAEDLVDAIDERTLLVPISFVEFKTSYMIDLQPIQQRAAEAGAHVLLDTYQAVGAVPLAVEDWGVSFAVGGSVKWLCGGTGAGYLYVRSDLRKSLEPRLVGWQGHTSPLAFEPGPIRYAQNMLRFGSGTPAVSPLVAAAASYQLIRDIGIPAIRARSLNLTQHLIDGAEALGMNVTSQVNPDRRGASVAIAVDDMENAAAWLADQDVYVDCRPGAGLRIGPHVYNTVEEIDRLLELLHAWDRKSQGG